MQMHQSWLGGGVGALLAVLTGLILFLSAPGKGLRDWSFDLPFLFRPEQQINEIVIVSLGDESYATLKQEPAHFDRALHAKLVRRLNDEGAKLIVFDVLFIDESLSLPASDQAFATAMKDCGRVVIGAQLFKDDELGTRGTKIWPPLGLFREAAAGWGLARVHRDTDFAARLIYPGTDDGPGLAWKAAALSGANIAQQTENLVKERWLNYYGQKPFINLPYSDVVSGKPLPSNFSFKDKVVFVGSGEAAGFHGDKKEQFRYPWTWISGEFAFGVQIHALTYANLARQDWMTRIPTGWEILLLLICGVLAGYGLSCLRPLAATGVAIGGAIVIAAGSIWVANHFHVWFSWLVIVAVELPIALSWSYLFNSIRSFIQTRILETSLGLYLSPQQVKQILREPKLLKPGAKEKTVSILFSDIAGFSKISERMNAEDLVKLLNAYYETAIRCIHETQGTVMNLIGDAIFAIWNAPQEQDDHQDRACRAALLLNEALIKFDSASLNLPLNTRVGLHTGSVCVGNIGSTTRFEYTAIGESVNMASRLEGLNKQLGTNILATRDIQKTIEGKLVTRLVGHFKFKGFDQIVEVHEVVGLPEIEEESRPWRQCFATALSRFQRKSFAEAEDGFRRTLELCPSDGPSKFYLERIAKLQTKTLSADWFGEVGLQEK